MVKSCVGPGMKAGGPNYVAQFLRFKDAGASDEHDEIRNARLLEFWDALEAALSARTDALGVLVRATGAETDARRIFKALTSYDRWWWEEFGREHDHFRLLGQDNIRRYLPFREIRVRVAEGDSLFDAVGRACAATVTGARVIVSSRPGTQIAAVQLLDYLTDSWAGAIEFVEESDEELADLIRNLPAHSPERIRYASKHRVPEMVRRAAAESGVYIADEPVLAAGRIELLWYLREQSISYDYHRYGNLGARAEENRKGPASPS